MQHLIVFVFSLGLIFPPPVQAKSKLNNTSIYISFSEKLNPRINRFRSSHEVAKKLLQQKQIEKEFHQVAHFFLGQKNILLPKMKVDGDTLNFTFRGQEVAVKHKAGSQYIVNEKMVDFAKLKLPQGGSALFQNWLFPKAEAAIPLAVWYFGGIVVTVFLAGSCMNGNLSSSTLFGGGSDGAKWVQVPPNELTRALNNAMREVVQLCGAANASNFNSHYDFPAFLNQHCQSLGEAAIGMYGEHSPNATRSDGSVNPQVFRWAAQRPHQISTDVAIENSMTNARIQVCQDVGCNQRQPQRVGFNQMDGVISERMEALLQDRSFQRACVERGLQLATGYAGANGESYNPNPAPGTTSPSEM